MAGGMRTSEIFGAARSEAEIGRAREGLYEAKLPQGGGCDFNLRLPRFNGSFGATIHVAAAAHVRPL